MKVEFTPNRGLKITAESLVEAYALKHIEQPPSASLIFDYTILDKSETEEDKI